MPHNKQNYDDYHAGDDLTISIPVVDENGNAQDISNLNEAEWYLKDHESDADGDALVSKSYTGGGITLNANSDGLLVDLNGTDTENLDGAKYHVARLEDSTGDRSTLLEGRFVIS